MLSLVGRKAGFFLPLHQHVPMALARLVGCPLVAAVSLAEIASLCTWRTAPGNALLEEEEDAAVEDKRKQC